MADVIGHQAGLERADLVASHIKRHRTARVTPLLVCRQSGDAPQGGRPAQRLLAHHAQHRGIVVAHVGSVDQLALLLADEDRQALGIQALADVGDAPRRQLLAGEQLGLRLADALLTLGRLLGLPGLAPGPDPMKVEPVGTPCEPPQCTGQPSAIIVSIVASEIHGTRASSPVVTVSGSLMELNLNNDRS